MPTKSTTVKLTAIEINFNRRVKSVELAIKTQGKTGITSETLIKVAEKIFEYLNKTS